MKYKDCFILVFVSIQFQFQNAVFYDGSGTDDVIGMLFKTALVIYMI